MPAAGTMLCIHQKIPSSSGATPPCSLPSLTSTSASRRLQLFQIRSMSPLRVAFQGAPGAYSEFAARTAIPDCSTIPCRTISDTITAVESGLADRAVIPVENTTGGTALRNYDLILRHSLPIVQEVSLFVHYCLLAMPGVRRDELRTVMSHPVALTNCGRTLAQLGLDGEPAEDTAGAVQILRRHQLVHTAAIASPRAALLYGLDIVVQGLQDESWNVTRFLLLSATAAAPPSLPRGLKAKTSMVVAHNSGPMAAVLGVLSAFSKRGVNLTKMEVTNAARGDGGATAVEPVVIRDTRRSHGGVGSFLSFPHVIYIDCEGSVEDHDVKEAISEITTSLGFVRVLGCYAADSNIYDLKAYAA